MYFIFFLYSIRFHILLEDVNFLVYIFLEITCTPDTLIKNFVYMLSQHFEINLDYTCDMLLFFVHLYSAAKYFIFINFINGNELSAQNMAITCFFSKFKLEYVYNSYISCRRSRRYKGGHSPLKTSKRKRFLWHWYKRHDH